MTDQPVLVPFVEDDGSPAGGRSGRIPFRLRIGVIGHVKLADTGELRAAVRAGIECAVKQTGYHSLKSPATSVTLTVVSSLAEGADRIVADEVLKTCGGRLMSVMPVPKEDLDVYRSDFKDEGSRGAFDAYQASAWRPIYPTPGTVPRSKPKEEWAQDADQGYTDDDRKAGYRWAAHTVARNCDVLIALWDQEGSRGTGGTADTMKHLRQRDEQIYDAEPSRETTLGMLGSTAASLLFSTDEPIVLEAAGPLRIIVPTKGKATPMVDDDDDSFKRAADVVRKRLTAELKSLDRLNRKKVKRATWSKADEDARKYLASDLSWRSERLAGIFESITPSLIRADERAKTANRHFLRMSYLQFCSTAAATVIAALEAVVFPGVWGLTIGEIGFLLASVVTVVAEQHWKTHELWTDYRFLAEQLRSVYYLLAVGVMPDQDLEAPDVPVTPGRSQHGWVARAFAEVLAEQVPPGGLKVTEPLDVLNGLVRSRWVQGQITYFRKTSVRLTRNHNAVRSLLVGVLFVTIAAAVVHSLGLWPNGAGQTEALAMCAIGLPAVAAALATLRSLREFIRHASRYANMATLLDWYLRQSVAEESLPHLQKLAQSVYDVLTAESRGWLSAVTGRDIEIG